MFNILQALKPLQTAVMYYRAKATKTMIICAHMYGKGEAQMSMYAHMYVQYARSINYQVGLCLCHINDSPLL